MIGRVTRVRLVHTGELGAQELRHIRELLDVSFGPEFDDDNFAHALGGMHATITDDDRLVAHGALVLRHLVHDTRVLRTGYVEALAVHPDRRGEGLAGHVMDELERLIHGAYELGALGSSEAGRPLYLRRGWRPWPGSLSVITPDGLRPTPEEAGGILVLPVGAPAYWSGDLACDWRASEVW